MLGVVSFLASRLAGRTPCLAPFALLLAAACGGPPRSVQRPLPTAGAPAILPGARPLDPLDRPLPLDARVKRGKLDSGLTYYVLPHQKPEKRAQLWLVVNAGATLENEDERGLAHFVEHMAFEGTRRFPKHALTDLIEKSGGELGADLNAQTSPDDTLYKLQIPTDQPELLGQAIRVLRDWADGVQFDAAAIDRERSVILEEWRAGRGADRRVFEKQSALFFAGSRYAERHTIGQLEVLKTASREALMRFYRDWYRPDLMAVIAVGDFDGSAVERDIQREFASLARAQSPRPRTVPEMPPHDTLYSVETDPELSETHISISRELPRRVERTERDYRRSLTESLFTSMLVSRLEALRFENDMLFWAPHAWTSNFVRAADSYGLMATAKESEPERALAVLLAEQRRVETQGVTETELERAKSTLLQRLRRYAKRRSSRDAEVLAAEISRHFLLDEAMTGNEHEVVMAERFLPGLTVAGVVAASRTLARGSRTITVAGPPSMKKPTVAVLAKMTREADASELPAYADTVVDVPLMDAPPTNRGRLVAVTQVPEIGVTEWTLQNGVRIVVKPTSFADDQVLMTAFSPGGTSLAANADYVSANQADTLVAETGVASFNEAELENLLSGKGVSVDVSFGELETSLHGHSSETELETMMQLVHLRFTAPKDYTTGVPLWRERELGRLKNRRLSPDDAFDDELRALSTMNHPRRRPLPAESIRNVDYAKAKSFYKDRLANAGNFTFIFVGSIDMGTLRPLVETYLGSLPAGHKETWRDPNVTWPTGVRTKTFRMGHEPKATVALAFHGNEAWSLEAGNDLDVLGRVLASRLRDRLRGDLGGVYNVDVATFFERRPRPEYEVSIRFDCAPANVEVLRKAIFAEIDAIQTNGVDDVTVAKIKEQRRRALEVDRKDNGHWLGALENAYTFGDHPRRVLESGALIEKGSAARVREAAKKYLSSKQYALVVRLPEAGATAR